MTLIERKDAEAEKTRVLARWQHMKRFGHLEPELPKLLLWIRSLRIESMASLSSRRRAQ